MKPMIHRTPAGVANRRAFSLFGNGRRASGSALAAKGRPAPSCILVVQTKYIGDMVLTSVLVRNLRLAYPDAKIAMLCTPNLRDFVISQNIADEAIAFDRRDKGKSLFQRLAEYLSVVSDLRQRFDLTIDLSDSKTSRIVHRSVGAPMPVGFDPTDRPMKFWESQPANVFAAPYGQGGSHYVYRHLSPMQALGLDAADVTPRLAPTPDAQWESTTILAGRGLSRNAYIAVHASARDNGGDGAFLDDGDG
ncbi:hypothetical protein [Mesorhizobium sp.]|uniref:glycosyltransferase family 9 protein n=1 Tax=Mesorhizobium sp. TaxID=1871066 RepID=UPI000FE48618|nr:hypothetical protein [Mesorhizobium sp.]RWD46711.1 MAG: hypothetical protein EOS35_09260 [Mesorhizobium sp.]